MVRSFIDKRATRAMTAVATGTLSDEQLVTQARAYAEDHFPSENVASMTAEVRRRVVGMDRNEVQQWEVTVDLRRFVNGVPSFNYVILRMNPATGDVAGVIHDTGAVNVDTAPKTSRASALALVSKAAYMPIYKVDKCDLFVVRDSASGRARLVWHVEIHTGDRSCGAKAWATVDAETGSLLNLDVNGTF